MIVEEEIEAGGVVAYMANELTMGQAEAFLYLEETWVDASPEKVRGVRLSLALVAIGVDRWGGSFEGLEWPELDGAGDYMDRIKVARRLTMKQVTKIGEAISSRMYVTEPEGNESEEGSGPSTD